MDMSLDDCHHDEYDDEIYDDEINEDIFDTVNTRYTNEYESYVRKVDELLPTDTTMQRVGGEINYARILSWTITYNKNCSDTAKEAAQIRKAVNLPDFDMNHCLNDGVMFWNFLKSLDTFQRSAWYYKEYMLAKLLGNVVDIETIFYARMKEDIKNNVEIQVATSVQVPSRHGSGWINNICKEDMDVIDMYFKERGDKRQLCKRFYNWFRRKLNIYKYYLSQLFPTDIIATTHITKQKTTKAIQYKRKKRRIECINSPIRYPIIKKNSNTGCIHSPILVTNIDDNNNNNEVYNDSEQSLSTQSTDSHCMEIANMPIYEKVKRRIIHIDMDGEEFKTLIQRWPNDIKVHIIDFLKQAENIWS